MLGIFLVVLFLFSKLKEKPVMPAAEGPQLSDCETLAQIEPLCLAVVKKDSSYCNNEQNETKKNWCFAGSHFLLAIQNSDANECEKIAGDENRKNICLAVAKSDSSFCDKSTADADICKQILRMEKPSIEGEILGADFYYWVIALRNKNVSACNNIANRNDADMCNAILKHDEKYCKDMQECYDIVYSGMAAYWRNSSYCNKIKFEYTRNDCLSRVS